MPNVYQFCANTRSKKWRHRIALVLACKKKAFLHQSRNLGRIFLYTQGVEGVADKCQIWDSLKTLPKALRTQALTALTSYFGFGGLVQYA